MGLFKAIGNIFKQISTQIGDSFRTLKKMCYNRLPDEKKFKKIIKDKSLTMNQKLYRVFELNTFDSAIWWFDNSIKNNNVGNKEDIYNLHLKYMKLKNADVAEEKLKQFVLHTLPDIDYKSKGFETKTACLEEMYKEWQPFQIIIYNKTNRAEDLLSPYYTLAYYGLFWRKITNETAGKKLLLKLLEDFIHYNNSPVFINPITNLLEPIPPTPKDSEKENP